MSNETDLSTVNGALANLDGFLASIDDAKSADDALWQAKLMDEFLRKADECGEYAAAFCFREAQILVRAASLPDHLEVRRRKGMIAWLRSKTIEQVQEILDECATGVRIGVIKARETRAANAQDCRDRQIDEFKRISSKLIDEVGTTGRTTISVERFYAEWRLAETPDRQTMAAFREKTKNDALGLGAVGLGDGSGTYAIPVKCDREDTRLYVENRLRSMHHDIVSLTKHCRASNFAVAHGATDALRADLDELEALNDRD